MDDKKLDVLRPKVPVTKSLVTDTPTTTAVITPLHPSDDPGFIPLSPTQVPHGVPKELSVWAISDEDTRMKEDRIAKLEIAREDTPRPGTQWVGADGTVIEVTEADKDELINVFIAEHKKANGIPRYENVIGALLYYNVKPTVTLPPPPPL